MVRSRIGRLALCLSAAALLLPADLSAQSAAKPSPSASAKPSAAPSAKPSASPAAPKSSASPSPKPSAPTPATGKNPAGKPNASPSPSPAVPKVDPAIADQPDGLYALFETSRGNILASLDLQRCPMTVTAFIGLAEGTIKAAERPGRFYDGLVFHRVVSKAAGAEYDFMIQGGDPAGDGSGGPGFSFADELDPALNFDAAGRLAMANGGPDSNGSQFFITLAPAPWLDQRHTIFGQVMKGQDNAAGILPGDKITKLTILRKGMAAEAFQADPAAFDLSQKAAADVYAKKIADAVAKALPGAQKAPDGALFVIDRPGSGAAPLAGQTVTMNYSGSFLSGRTVDASPEGQPVSVKVGTGRLIAGWDQALMDMKTGEKRRVLLPPELAFGANGISGMIPPGSWLLLDIELVSVSN